MQHRLSRGGRLGVHAGAFALFFLYLVVLRTRGISENFWLLGDQIRDWPIALGPWRDLPLSGVPSNAGGATLGPVYYWTLWAIRHLLGPWTDNLPHAGGVGLAVIQSAADCVFLFGIWRYTKNAWLAFATALFVATAPYDMALTVAMSNPPLAVALVKIAIALVLIGGQGASIWWTVAATAAAWLAVQAHSTAIFFAAPVILAFAAKEMAARRWQSAFVRLAATAVVIAILQLPFAIDFLRHPPEAAAPWMVVNSLSYTLNHPSSLQMGKSFSEVGTACDFLLMIPWIAVHIAPFATILGVCALVTAFRARRDLMLASVTVLPLAAFVAGFSTWQLNFDSYFCLPVAPSAALTIALALTAWRPSARGVAIVLTVAVLVLQPARRAAAMTFHRFPQYGSLVRGSREIRRRTPEIQGIDTEFALPFTSDPTFLYTAVLGGQITPEARYSAVIDAAGRVRFNLVKP